MHGASGVPSWVWILLSNLIGSDNALVVQTIVMIIVYGLVGWVLLMQILRLIHNWGERNHSNPQIRETAKENVRASIIIIVVVVLIAGIGLSSVFFFLNKFLGM